MSYDIFFGPSNYFVCEQCNHKNDISEWQQEGNKWNQTWNLSNLFYDYVCITDFEYSDWGLNMLRADWDEPKRQSGLECLHNLNGSRASVILDRAIKKIIEERRCNRSFDDKYNPDNGWGSVEGALELLKEIYYECLSHPSFFINVY